MSMYKDKEQFLEEVLSYIKLPFDRNNIYEELNAHIEDSIEDFIEEGYSNKEATIRAVENMGNAEDVGRELNQIHKPLLGWIWKTSQIIVAITGILSVLFVISLVFKTINYSNPLKNINENDIVYHLKVNEKATIDNFTIKITDLLYETDGTMHICFITYQNPFYLSGWSFSNIGTITDDSANEYYGGIGSIDCIISFNDLEIENFIEESDTLNIVYDSYNRHYEFHFDLKEGKENG